MTSINDLQARILACDFGTSGLTLGLYNPHTNKMEGFGGAVYHDMNNLPEKQWVEQDPRSWIEAIPKAMAELRQQLDLIGDDVVGIGIGGHMHAPVLLDEHNQPVMVDDQLVCGAIMWNDPRGEPEGQVLSKILGQPIFGSYDPVSYPLVRADAPETLAGSSVPCHRPIIVRRFGDNGRVRRRSWRCERHGRPAQWQWAD